MTFAKWYSGKNNQMEYTRLADQRWTVNGRHCAEGARWRLSLEQGVAQSWYGYDPCENNRVAPAECSQGCDGAGELTDTRLLNEPLR